MTDLQDIRSLLRVNRSEPAAAGGSPKPLFWIAAGLAAMLGFAVVLFAPRLYTVQRTAALPTFKELAKADTGAPAAPAAFGPAANPARSAGNGADEMVRSADAVCAQRAPSQALSPAASGAAAAGADRNDRLHCLLTEAPARYCAAGQRQRITAEVINYFKAIEYANAAKGTASRAAGFAVDPRVVEGVEGLIRAGYLMKPQRDDIATIVPRDVRERFARVVGNKFPCPEPPWWAVWK